MNVRKPLADEEGYCVWVKSDGCPIIGTCEDVISRQDAINALFDLERIDIVRAVTAIGSIKSLADKAFVVKEERFE